MDTLQLAQCQFGGCEAADNLPSSVVSAVEASKNTRVGSWGRVAAKLLAASVTPPTSIRTDCLSGISACRLRCQLVSAVWFHWGLAGWQAG